MRVGTWNLAGRWDDRHEHLMRQQECDVWLLTEVSERLALAGYEQSSTTACLAQRRRWAAILSREKLASLPDSHPASALACAGEVLFCSSILPWRSCGGQFPWIGNRHADRTEAVLTQLLEPLSQRSLIWGGDWNHALTGPESSGSKGGRAHIKWLRACQAAAPSPCRVREDTPFRSAHRESPLKKEPRSSRGSECSKFSLLNRPVP